MKYYSTRDAAVRMDAAEAIKMGLSRDGGLLTPCGIPQIDRAFLESLVNVRYQERAAKVMGLYLTDYTYEELSGFAENAYGPEKFDCDAVAPVRTVDETTHCLELWHGPTSAFKDMALQMLPQLLSAALRKTGESKTVCILVATSGDTGKAAMEGFADVPQTKILVFYPKDGVSKVQETQMVTQDGANVGVCAVEGNFDDAQAGVKRIFSDEAIRATLADRGYFLSSANSINWGRILPQVVYYISAYCDLVRDGKLTMGDKVNFCVPTGNFGDILAAYYAKRMGLRLGSFAPQLQRCADGLPPHRRLRQEPSVPYHHESLYGHSGVQQPGAAAVRPLRRKRCGGEGLHGCPRQDRQVRSVRRHQGGSGGPVLGRLLRRGGHLRCHRQVLQGERVSDRYPHRRGRQRHGTVPQGHRRQDGDGVRLHRLPLQVLRPRAAGHRGDPGGRRRGAAGPAA
ncbi:MAG: threonine synthase [Dysosmobacter welbionis]